MFTGGIMEDQVSIRAVRLNRPYIIQICPRWNLRSPIDHVRARRQHGVDPRGFIGERHLSASIGLAPHDGIVTLPEQCRRRWRSDYGIRIYDGRDSLNWSGIGTSSATTDEDEWKKQCEETGWIRTVLCSHISGSNAEHQASDWGNLSL